MTEEIVRFYSELKRRKVIRVGMFYAFGAFALLQIGDVAFEPLELPPWALRSLIYAVILGFPFTLLMAWFFDLTRHGFRRDPFDLRATGEYTTFAPATEFGNTASIAVLLEISQSDRLLAGNPLLARSIRNRFPYIDPLNHLQVELLKAHREGSDSPKVLRGLQLTINGISAGLRNSG